MTLHGGFMLVSLEHDIRACSLSSAIDKFHMYVLLKSCPRGRTQTCSCRDKYSRYQVLYDRLAEDLDLQVWFDRSKLKRMQSTLELWRRPCIMAANKVLVQCE